MFIRGTPLDGNVWFECQVVNSEQPQHGRVPLARTFQIDPGAVMERYDPILLNSIKNQSVSTMKYKEHMRTALSPEYQYFEKREGNRTSEVDFCKMISDSQQIASFWQHSSIQRPLFI